MHLIVLWYWAIALFSQKSETGTFPTRLNHTFLWLTLLQIGCFTFNVEMNIFPPSATWLSVVIIASSLALIGLTFRDLLPEKAMAALLFLVGVGFLLDLYFVVILMPMLPLSFIGLILLGLTVYSFGPLLKVIFILRFLWKNHAFMPQLTRFFAYGVSFSTIMTLLSQFMVVDGAKSGRGLRKNERIIACVGACCPNSPPLSNDGENVEIQSDKPISRGWFLGFQNQ